jgi:hypothetical protein
VIFRFLSVALLYELYEYLGRHVKPYVILRPHPLSRITISLYH